MPENVWLDLESDLNKLKQQHLYRHPEIFKTKKNSKKLGEYVDFSSNDYLGLSRHPAIIQKSTLAAKKWGTGSAASRLLSGNLIIHDQLERKIAQFKKEEAASVFSSGYLANLGVIRSLVNEKDVVILDRNCHASLIDGARLSRAKFWVYEHLNVDQLTSLLVKARRFRRRLVITDAYFSMDGDIAPLEKILKACNDHESLLMIDEAHSTGIFGETGSGLSEHFRVFGKIHVVMGTLSKALGSVGGYVAGKDILIKTLVNTCRPYIYTTAPSPAASAAAFASIDLVRSSAELRQKLWENVRILRNGLTEYGFDLMGSQGPIIPVKTGSPEKALKIKEILKESGYFVSAIRFPTVAKGSERIRISVSSAHSLKQIHAFLLCLRKNRGFFEK